MNDPGWPDLPGSLSRAPVRVRIARVADLPALWQGRAEADSDIVPIALSRYRANLHWSRSSRHGPWTDDLPGLHVGLWISEIDDATLARPASIQLQLSGLASAWSVMTTTPAAVDIRETIETRTGRPTTLLRIAGDDPLDVALLFIARSDVRSLRGGAWRVRDAALPGAPPLWTPILTGPRFGSHPL